MASGGVSLDANLHYEAVILNHLAIIISELNPVSFLVAFASSFYLAENLVPPMRGLVRDSEEVDGDRTAYPKGFDNL